jgi:uncharacterized integral membrane protein
MAGDGGSGRNISPKLILAGILVLVIVILAIANSKKVNVDFVVTDINLPLFVVIVGAAVIGWIVGWFMGRHRGD